jgi:hypothetical protein
MYLLSFGGLTYNRTWEEDGTGRTRGNAAGSVAKGGFVHA